MKSVYDTILAVRNTASKNEKLEILSKQKHNLALREFLRITYEPRINFYISKVDTSVKKVTGPVVNFERELLESVIATLGEREKTGNAAKQWLGELYASFANDWERELLVMLIERDCRAGFSESTINKVWADTVTDIPYMRCSLPKDAKLESFPWSEGVFSQIKADGMFANISYDGAVRIESRNGSPFPLDAFKELVAEIKDIIPLGHQTHGELLVARKKMSGFDILPRQEGNGMLNKLLKGGELPQGHVVIYEAWDMIPLTSATAKGKYNVPYKDRWAALVRAANEGTTNIFRLIETQIVHSIAAAIVHYQYALSRGLEGTIIKHPGMFWKDGTSKEQVKMKLEFEVDLEVEGYLEGTGKAVGMLGALQLKTSCGQLKVKCGSGFSDALRKEIWANKNLKIITVKSNSIMPPTSKDTYSLFLPIFVEERLDKKEADSLKRVFEQYEASIS